MDNTVHALSLSLTHTHTLSLSHGWGCHCSYKEKEGLAPAAYLSRYTSPHGVGASPAELVESVRDAVQQASGTKLSWKPSARVDVQERKSLTRVGDSTFDSGVFYSLSYLCTNPQKGISKGEGCVNM